MATLIAGVHWYGGPPTKAPLPEVMLRASGAWVDGHVCSGTDASGEFQFAIASKSRLTPVFGVDQSITLADVDTAWWASGAPRAGHVVSPDEFAAELAEHDDQTPARLDGEYAFARYDPSTRSLTLGRDGAGVRPLYFIHVPGRCAAFASLLPGLLAARLFRHEVDREIIAKLATVNHAHGETTQFTHIRRVIPGDTITLSRDGADRRQHWRLTCYDPISPSADRDAVMAELRGKLDIAVRRRIPASGPVFSHLSGGLDSSSIAVLAARAAAERGDRVRGYAFGGRPMPPDIPVVDEQPAIDSILDAFPNIDLLQIEGPDFEALVRTPMTSFFPSFDGPDDLYQQVVRDAAARGATTILAGYGGDEVTSYAGNGGFAEMFVKGRWRALWRIARASAIQTGRPAWRIIGSEIKRFVLPGLLPGLNSNGQGRNAATIRQMNRYLQPEFHNLAMEGDPGEYADTAEMRVGRIHSGHMSWMCEQMAQLAGPYGLRYSMPLLDRDVLEFAIRLPPEFMHVNGLMRAGLREPMKGLLPETARIRRTKLHFDPACAHVFAREKHELLELVQKLETGPAADVFRLDVLREDIAMIPGPESVLENIRAAALRNEQYLPPELALAHPVFMARFLDTATRMLDDQSTPNGCP